MCFFKDFIKNPQTTIALTFLTHIISGIDGVFWIISSTTYRYCNGDRQENGSIVEIKVPIFDSYKPKIRTISAATLAGKSPKIPALFQTCFEFGRLHWALDYITVNFERKFKCLQFSQKTELENLNFCPRVG